MADLKSKYEEKRGKRGATEALILRYMDCVTVSRRINVEMKVLYSILKDDKPYDLCYKRMEQFSVSPF